MSRTQLAVGEVLNPDETITSPNGRYVLYLHANGNMIETAEKKRTIWDSGSGGDYRAKLIMQDDGNLVISDANSKSRWHSGSFGKGNRSSIFKIQNDGNAVVVSDGNVIWASNAYETELSSLEVGQSMSGSTILISPNRKVYLKVDGDRNDLNLFQDGKRIWYQHEILSNVLKMNRDDNITLHWTSRIEEARWSSGIRRPNPTGNAALLVQDNGVAVIKTKAGQVLWSTNEAVEPVIGEQPEDYTKPVEVGSHRFSQGQFLLPGQSLISPKKTFSALLRDDASFAVYRNSNKTLVWTSKPYPNPVKLCFSYHNALLLFQKKGSVLLSENLSDRKAGSCDLTLDDDGYLYIPGDRTGNTKWDVYNGGAWWSSQWNNEFWLPVSAGEVDCLLPGQSLAVDQTITKDGKTFGFTENANMFVRAKDGTTTYYYTGGEKGGAQFLKFTRDKIVISDTQGKALYTTSFDDPKGGRARYNKEEPTKLGINNDGEFNVTFDNRVLWNPANIPNGSSPTFPTTVGNRLSVGKVLWPGQSLQSTTGRHSLKFGKDGTLVLVQLPDRVLWNSGSQTKSADRITLQPDGNLIMYNPQRLVKWASQTSRDVEDAGMELLLQENGHPVIRNGTGNVIALLADSILIAPCVSRIEIVGGQDLQLIISDEHLSLPADRNFANTSKAVQGTRILYEADDNSSWDAEKAYACLWNYDSNQKNPVIRIEVRGVDDSLQGQKLSMKLTSKDATIFESEEKVLDGPNITFELALRSAGGSNYKLARAPYGFQGQVQVKLHDSVKNADVYIGHPLNLEFYFLSAGYLPPKVFETGVPLQLLRMFVLAAGVQATVTTEDWIKLVIGIVHGSRKPGTGEPTKTTGHWLRYESYSGQGAFAGKRGGDVNIQAWLDAYQNWKKFGVHTSINCYDQAAISEVAMSLGLPHDCIHWEYHQVYGFIKDAELVGYGDCNNPYFSGDTSKIKYQDLQHADRQPFRNHAYLSWTTKKLTQDDYSAYKTLMDKVNTYAEYSAAAQQFEQERGIQMKMIDACAGPHLGTESRKEYEDKKELIPDPATSFCTYVKTDYKKNQEDISKDPKTEKRWAEDHYLGMGITGLDPEVPKRAKLLAPQRAAEFPAECSRIGQLFTQTGSSDSPYGRPIEDVERAFQKAFKDHAGANGWKDANWIPIRPYQQDEGTTINEAKVYFKVKTDEKERTQYLSLRTATSSTADKARDQLASHLTYNELATDRPVGVVQGTATESGISIVGRPDGWMRALVWKNVSAEITGDVDDVPAYVKLAAAVAEELS